MELPGRGRLHAAPQQTRLSKQVPLLRRNSMLTISDRLLCLGTAIAFEFTYQLEREIGTSPLVVFASAAHAPSLGEHSREVHLMSDAELIVELKRLNGTPPGVRASPELLELILPVLRADFQLAAGYQRNPEERRSSPLPACTRKRGAVYTTYIRPAVERRTPKSSPHRH